MRRRKPESMEVKQMRQQAMDDRRAKKAAIQDEAKALSAKLAKAEKEAAAAQEGKCMR